jgi:hypothetical protein
MPALPELEELQDCIEQDYPYDFAQAERIVSALDFLRKEAVNTGIEEVITMVDATYHVLATAYHCLRRGGKLPRLERLDAGAGRDGVYDLGRMEHIVSALDFLRKEAVHTGIGEMVVLIDSCFRLLVTAYYCILRHEMAKLPGTDMIQ